MQQCINCGTQLEPEAAFCPVCGTPRSAPVVPTQNNKQSAVIANAPYGPPPVPSPAPSYPGMGGTPLYGPGPSSPGNVPAQPYGMPPATPGNYGALPVYETPPSSLPGAYGTPPPYGAPPASPPAYGTPPSSPGSYGTPPPYSSPSAGYYGASPTAPTSKGKGGLSRGVIALILVVASLLLISGVGLTYYAAVLHPAQLQAQATETAQKALTASAQASATAVSQATATANAQAAATANAQSTAVAQATALAQATATALQNVYTQSTNGTPALDDPLSGPSSANWNTFTADDGSSCSFTNGALHASETQKNYYIPCFAQNTSFGNFALEVKMTILKGDEGGILFRANDATNKDYSLNIESDGSYYLYLHTDDKTSNTLIYSKNAAIKTDPGQPNTLTIIAKDSTIYLYINQQFVGSASDSTLSSGEIGLFAGDNTNATEVTFTNLRVWKL